MSNSERIIALILRDIRGRKGIGDAWESIDDSIQDEIIDKWKRFFNESATAASISAAEGSIRAEPSGAQTAADPAGSGTPLTDALESQLFSDPMREPTLASQALCRSLEHRLAAALKKIEQLRIISNVNGDWSMKYQNMCARAEKAEAERDAAHAASDEYIRRTDPHIAELAEKLENSEADAERYLWLRNNLRTFEKRIKGEVTVPLFPLAGYLDAAIDTARKDLT